MSHFRADEEFLTGSVGQGDGLPAVLRWHGDVDFDLTFGVANLAYYAWNNRTDVVAQDEAVEHRAQVFENAVLDLELAFTCAESEGQSENPWFVYYDTWRIK